MNYHCKLFCTKNTAINLEYVTEIYLSVNSNGVFQGAYYSKVGSEDKDRISDIHDAKKFVCHYFAFSGTNVPESFKFILGIKDDN